MPIDIDKVASAELTGDGFSWDEDDIILYNLAVGAGDPPIEPRELRYTYEGDLRPLPTFGTIPPFGLFMNAIVSMEGLEISLAQVLHGEQKLVINGPIPTSGTVSHVGRVVAIYDKGRGAVIVLEVDSRLESGEALFTNRSSIYVRGEGGFGGDSGPPAGNEPPSRRPDYRVESATLPQQALLYRLASGDRNPLHADPGFAALAGFERPILHGLCTYGVVGKAVTDHALKGDPGRVGSFEARFSGHVFPGETIVTSIWESEEGLLVAATVAERGTPVLSNALVRVT